MKLSIIVPAYNEEKKIAATLKGLLAQTYHNYELIVVDNNSSDQTNAIAKSFAKNVFVEKKKGYIHAVNRGAAEALGDLITFCDADTQYPKDWAAKIVSCFEKKPDAVAVYGTADTYDAHALQNWLNGIFYTAFLRLSRLLGLDNTSGFNFVMKKSAFEKVGGYDPAYQKMSPDIELGKRLKKVGKIHFSSQIKVRSSFRRYQEGGVSQTQWMFLKSWWAMLRGKTPNVNYEDYNQEFS